MSPSQLSASGESGETQPTTDKLPQLAMLLGVDVSALFAVEAPGRLPETLLD